MGIHGILCFLMIVVSAGFASAEEVDEVFVEAKTRRIQAVIEQLASRNRAPVKSGPQMVFPEEYSDEAQTAVYLAMRCLLGEGSDGIDQLRSRFDDTRYAYSYTSPNGIHNATVGGACQRLARRVILAFEPEMARISSDQVARPPWQDREFGDWWVAHRDRPLWELQISAIDAQIQVFETMRRETAASPHPLAEKLSEEKFERLRKLNLARLQEIKNCIKEGRRAIIATEIDEDYGAMTKMEWPTRSFGR